MAVENLTSEVGKQVNRNRFLVGVEAESVLNSLYQTPLDLANGLRDSCTLLMNGFLGDSLDLTNGQHIVDGFERLQTARLELAFARGRYDVIDNILGRNNAEPEGAINPFGEQTKVYFEKQEEAGIVRSS